LRLFEIRAAMMAPAAEISGGSNFSMNSVLMRSRAVSKCALRMKTEYGRIALAGHRCVESVETIKLFLPDSELIPRISTKILEAVGDRQCAEISEARGPRDGGKKVRLKMGMFVYFR
jgi:hypothetical protein